MANCINNSTLAIGRPSNPNSVSGGTATCNTSTGSTGISPALSTRCPGDISARPNREKVRENLRDYVLLMLGAPVVKVELDQQGLDLAVDQALTIYEDYAPREFFNYYVFRTQAGKSVYKMPPDVGIIRNVFYKEEGTFAFQASDLDGAIPVEYFYPGGAYSSIQGGLIDPIQPIWGRMGEWVLYKQYEQMFSRTSSNLGGWEWVGGLGSIKLYPIPCKCQSVMVHYLQKCKDWNEVNQAMQEGALAHAMIMLGHIRGKYQNPPGPGGGMQLDGEYYKSKGWELYEAFLSNLLSRYGDILPITLDSGIMSGFIGFLNLLDKKLNTNLTKHFTI